MKIIAHTTDREIAAFQAGRAVEAALAWRARKRLLNLSGLPNFGAIEMCSEGARNAQMVANDYPHARIWIEHTHTDKHGGVIRQIVYHDKARKILFGRQQP